MDLRLHDRMLLRGKHSQSLDSYCLVTPKPCMASSSDLLKSCGIVAWCCLEWDVDGWSIFYITMKICIATSLDVGRPGDIYLETFTDYLKNHLRALHTGPFLHRAHSCVFLIMYVTACFAHRPFFT